VEALQASPKTEFVFRPNVLNNEENRCSISAKPNWPRSTSVRQSVRSIRTGAKFWDCARRRNFAQLLAERGKRNEAPAMLPDIYNWFETMLLTHSDNLAGLVTLNRELIARADAIAAPRRVVLDLDSTEIRVHGQQEQSAYNGHFASTCYPSAAVVQS
jgi:hypothetical protein